MITNGFMIMQSHVRGPNFEANLVALSQMQRMNLMSFTKKCVIEQIKASFHKIYQCASLNQLVAIDHDEAMEIRTSPNCSGGAPFQAYFASRSELYGAHGMQSGPGSQYRRRWGMGG
jgi:hypothetical protein